MRSQRLPRVAGVIVILAVALLGSACRSEATREAPAVEGTWERFQAPSALASYRYSLVVEASTELMDLSQLPAGLDFAGATLRVEIEGARVNPDREYSHSRSSFAFLSLDRETIVIGDQLWSRQAGGAWRQRVTLTGPEDLIGHDVGLSPAVIFGDDDPALLRAVTDDLESRPFTTEVIRGRETRRWTLDREWVLQYDDAFTELMPGFEWPERIQIDIWGDVEHRMGIRLLVVAGPPTNPDALRLEMDLFDLDDPEIAVEVPAGAIGP